VNSPIAETSSSSGWLVVWTESRAEKRVASRLAAAGMDAWLPVITQRNRWSDRWRDVVLPAFPGYLFARERNHGLVSLLRMPGVITVVKQGAAPARLADDYIAALRWALEESGVQGAPEPDHQFTVGEEVVIREGPLAGWRGLVANIRNERHLVIVVPHVGRRISFSIGAARVAKVASGAEISTRRGRSSGSHHLAHA
jgi:transcription antitermination factor NusG